MDYVADLLKEKGIPFNVSGHDYLIKCLNPEHNDSNPSCRVHKTTGAVHCFSCGFKSKSIFEYFGILTNNTFIRVAKLKEKIAQLKTNSTGLEVPPVAIPFTRSYRGISAITLQKFEAFYLPGESKQLKGFEDRIIFPIRDIKGKIMMFLGRHTLSQGNPRYLNYPHGVSIPLYPPVIGKEFKSIVMVEGMFDFLNCYDKGLLNTVCLFGTNSLQKDTKNKLLPYKMQGITKIYLMLDGDAPGREASKKLKPLIEAEEFECEVISLEDDQDPGELSQEYISSIKEYVNGPI
jgi:DNA primase